MASVTQLGKFSKTSQEPNNSGIKPWYNGKEKAESLMDLLPVSPERNGNISRQNSISPPPTKRQRFESDDWNGYYAPRFTRDRGRQSSTNQSFDGGRQLTRQYSPLISPNYQVTDPLQRKNGFATYNTFASTTDHNGSPRTSSYDYSFSPTRSTNRDHDQRHGTVSPTGSPRLSSPSIRRKVSSHDNDAHSDFDFSKVPKGPKARFKRKELLVDYDELTSEDLDGPNITISFDDLPPERKTVAHLFGFLRSKRVHFKQIKLARDGYYLLFPNDRWGEQDMANCYQKCCGEQLFGMWTLEMTKHFGQQDRLPSRTAGEDDEATSRRYPHRHSPKDETHRAESTRAFNGDQSRYRSKTPPDRLHRSSSDHFEFDKRLSRVFKRTSDGYPASAPKESMVPPDSNGDHHRNNLPVLKFPLDRRHSVPDHLRADDGIASPRSATPSDVSSAAGRDREKTCYGCKQQDQPLNALIKCATCNRRFHGTCRIPRPVPENANKIWHCKHCIKRNRHVLSAPVAASSMTILPLPQRPTWNTFQDDSSERGVEKSIDAFMIDGNARADQAKPNKGNVEAAEDTLVPAAVIGNLPVDHLEKILEDESASGEEERSTYTALHPPEMPGPVETFDHTEDSDIPMSMSASPIPVSINGDDRSLLPTGKTIDQFEVTSEPRLHPKNNAPQNPELLMQPTEKGKQSSVTAHLNRAATPGEEGTLLVDASFRPSNQEQASRPSRPPALQKCTVCGKKVFGSKGNECASCQKAQEGTETVKSALQALEAVELTAAQLHAQIQARSLNTPKHPPKIVYTNDPLVSKPPHARMKVSKRAPSRSWQISSKVPQAQENSLNFDLDQHRPAVASDQSKVETASISAATGHPSLGKEEQTEPQSAARDQNNDNDGEQDDCSSPAVKFSEAPTTGGTKPAPRPKTPDKSNGGHEASAQLSEIRPATPSNSVDGTDEAAVAGKDLQDTALAPATDEAPDGTLHELSARNSSVNRVSPSGNLARSQEQAGQDQIDVNDAVGSQELGPEETSVHFAALKEAKALAAIAARTPSTSQDLVAKEEAPHSEQSDSDSDQPLMRRLSRTHGGGEQRNTSAGADASLLKPSYKQSEGQANPGIKDGSSVLPDTVVEQGATQLNPPPIKEPKRFSLVQVAAMAIHRAPDKRISARQAQQWVISQNLIGYRVEETAWKGSLAATLSKTPLKKAAPRNGDNGLTYYTFAPGKETIHADLDPSEGQQAGEMLSSQQESLQQSAKPSRDTSMKSFKEAVYARKEKVNTRANRSRLDSSVIRKSTWGAISRRLSNGRQEISDSDAPLYIKRRRLHGPRDQDMDVVMQEHHDAAAGLFGHTAVGEPQNERDRLGYTFDLSEAENPLDEESDSGSVDSAYARFLDHDPRINAFTETDVFAARPDLHPSNTLFDAGTKIEEIRRRPNRKNRKAGGVKPAEHVDVRVKFGTLPHRLRGRVSSSSNSSDKGAVAGKASSYTASGMLNFRDEEEEVGSLRKVSTVEEVFNLPENMVPIVYDGQLAFRDGTKVNGELPRPKAVYKVGRVQEQKGKQRSW